MYPIICKTILDVRVKYFGRSEINTHFGKTHQLTHPD